MTRNLYIPTPPPISQPLDLLNYSNEHVAYEVDMFFKSILSKNVHLQGLSQDMIYFFKMARIETFVLHFRNIVAFIYPDLYQSRQGDLLAHHFLSGTMPWDTWVKARPAITLNLRNGKDRADKEMAHLTIRRIAGIPPHKAWDFIAIGNDIRTCLNVFIEVAAPNLLGPKVKEAIPVGAL